jgi:hypothetical protein
MEINLDFLIKAISLIGGGIALVRGCYDLYKWWGRRGRIDTRVLRLDYFSAHFTPEFFETEGVPGSLRADLLGKVSEAFSIIEFEIQNEFETPVTVFRLQLDDWIFSDHYVPGRPYGILRDYRVFDLYNKKEVNLDAHVLLEPHAVFGRRVEIHEGTWWGDPRGRSPRFLTERSQFLLHLNTTRGVIESPLSVTKPRLYDDLDIIQLWSEDQLTGREHTWFREGGQRP